MTHHIPWPEIDNFHTLRRNLLKYKDILLKNGSTIAYTAKVKLHGTNAGVRVDPDGTVTAFSRSQVITPQQDNCGFAGWVEGKREYFAKLADDKPFVIYGEWCGPGIQKGVAINGIPNRIFAVFGIRWVESDLFQSHPFVLGKRLEGIPDLYVLPHFESSFIISWEGTQEDTEEVLNRINAHVREVEREDPWVKSTFGISGVGEGLVFYPIDPGYKAFASLAFKAKGEKHSVVARTKPVQYNPTVVASLKEFADLVVTPTRLKQAARAVNGGELVLDMKNIGAFLKWINQDILKECESELEASKLDRSSATKACSSKARDWYMEAVKKV